MHGPVGARARMSLRAPASAEGRSLILFESCASYQNAACRQPWDRSGREPRRPRKPRRATCSRGSSPSYGASATRPGCFATYRRPWARRVVLQSYIPTHLPSATNTHCTFRLIISPRTIISSPFSLLHNGLHALPSSLIPIRRTRARRHLRHPTILAIRPEASGLLPYR